MTSHDTSDITPMGELLPPTPWSDIPMISTGGGGEATEIVCGYFRCDELLFNAFLRRLPPLFKVRPEGRASALCRPGRRQLRLADRHLRSGGWPGAEVAPCRADARLECRRAGAAGQQLAR